MVVEIRPRAESDALGILKVCTVPVEVIVKSVPEADTSKDCPALVKPLSAVIPPPAPASAPQLNCPVVAFQSNFPAGSVQDETSPAP